MASASSDLKSKYEEILRANGIEDEVANVTISKPDLKGLHLASVIDTATIDFVSGRAPLHLFVKKNIQTAEPAMDDHYRHIMVKEGKFLTDFVEEMKEFRKQRKGGPNISDLFPRVYYKDRDMIIQEDLAKRGFAIMPKDTKRSFEETKMALEHLARLHAVSHVMIAKAGGPKEFLKSHPYLSDSLTTPGFTYFINQTFEPSFEHTFSIIKYSTREDKQEKYELMAKYIGKIQQAFVETIETESVFYTVGHGDFWNNNVMLDIGATGTKLMLVDLQFSRINSPFFDVVRFPFVSSAPDVRKRSRELFQYYFNVLREYVLALEHPFPFVFEDFAKDISRKGKIDFLFALLQDAGTEAMETQSTDDLDKEDFGQQFMDLLVNYAKNNPEKVIKAGDRMVEMINDYLEFAQL